MTVLHILSGCEVGRSETYATDLILALRDAGLSQHVVVDKKTLLGDVLRKTGGANFRVHHLPIKGLQCLWLRGLIARLRPKAIHGWTRRAARLVPNNQTPLLAWIAGYDRPNYFNPGTLFVSPNCDTLARLEKEGVYSVRTFFIPMFANISSAPPLDRNALNTPREAKVMLTFSRLHPGNRLDAILGVLQHFPESYAWLAGEGPIQKELEKQAQQIGVLDRMRFVAPGMDRSALLRAADVCVLTAAEEPLGTTIAESWAAGTPLIVACEPASITSIDQDNDGLLIPAGDASALNLALQRLWGDEELRRRLIAKGYVAYIKNYTRESIVRQWVELYRSLRVGD